jgi:hypothetical protein
VNVTCKTCGGKNAFDQPSLRHAGFGNQGFLYDDSGTLTLIWSSFDPAYQKLVGQTHPWMLTESQRDLIEHSLRDAPNGNRWRFSNPPRCIHCGSPIGEPLSSKSVHYLRYPGSLDLDTQGFRTFASVLRAPNPRLERP